MNHNLEHKVIDSDVLFTIDAFTRKITTEDAQKNIIMQGDHSCERFTFQIPRFIEDHDMFECNVVQVCYINAENKKKDNKHITGVYLVDDVELDEENECLTCSWLISSNATKYAGTLSFMIRLSCLTGTNVDYRWNSDSYNDIYIAESLNSDLSFEIEHIDVIEQWKESVMMELNAYADSVLTTKVAIAKGDLKEDFDAQIFELDSNLHKRIDDLTTSVDEEIDSFETHVNENIDTFETHVNENLDTFDTILKTEITNMDGEINTLKARMDSFTSLPEGSTAGDAELADIRVGADGKNYSSAGAAVRGQFNGVEKIMDQYESMKGVEWSYGYLSSNGLVIEHTDGSTSDRMKTDFIPCGENVEVEYYSETNHESVFGIAFYDKCKNYILGISNDREPSAATVISPEGTAYVRISSKVSYLNKSYVRFGYNVYTKQIETALDIARDVKIKVDSLNSVEVNIPLRFYIGALNEYGEVFNSLSRATTIPFYVSGTYKATVSNENFLIYVYNRADDGGEAPTTGAWNSETTFTRTGNISIYVKKVDDTNITPDDMSTIVSSITLTRLADSALVHFDDLEGFVSRQAAEVFISPDSGNDENSGTFEEPFKSVQYAINSGYKNICLLPGVYRQSLYAKDINNLSIYAYNGDTYPSTDTPMKRARPVFTNGTLYDKLTTGDDGFKSFVLTEIPNRYKQVFIDKTLAPEKESTRPSYNAGLWATHTNKYDDYKLKPVLTYDELSEEGTFYFDGTNVFVNTKSDENVTGYTVVGDLDENLFHFIRCNGLRLNGITVEYALNSNYRLYFCNNMQVDHCIAAYTMFGDNFSCNYSDIMFNDCLSYKARNDGFNTHFYGVSIFNNCRGVYNYDDGESSHEYCKVIVNGGEYAHNGKGGHSPVNGCEFEANDCYCHHNTFGFYLIANEGYDLSDALVKISSCVSINNTDVDIVQSLYDVVVSNTKYNTTKINSGTFTDLTAE